MKLCESRTGKGTSSTRADRSLPSDAGFSRWGPRIQLESRIRRAIPILGGINNKPRHNRILMNIIPMMNEIPGIANPMIRKPALPHLGLASNQRPERMRVPARDQLNRAFDGDILSGSEYEMNLIGHEHKRMQKIVSFTSIVKRVLRNSRAYTSTANSLR